MKPQSSQYPAKKPARTGVWKLVDQFGNIFQGTFGQYALCQKKKYEQPLALRKRFKIVPL